MTFAIRHGLLAQVFGSEGIDAYRSAIVTTPDLLLYWRLSEVAAPFRDRSGNGFLGTENGTITKNVTGALTNTNSTDNKCVDLDGATGYISSNFSPFINGNTMAFEGIAWRDANTDDDCIVGSDGATPMILKIIAGSGDVGFWARSNTSNALWAAAWPGVAQWVHWVLSFDEPNNIAELFINGVSQGTRVYNGTFSTSGFFTAGSRGSQVTDPFNGKLDEITAYNRMLTAGEVQQHFNASGLGVTFDYKAAVMAISNLELYWRLGETTGTNANDETANNRDGTHQSGVTVGVGGGLPAESDKAADYPDLATGRTTSAYAPFVANAPISVSGLANRDTNTGADTLFGTDAAVNVILRLEAASGDVRLWIKSNSTSYIWTAAWPGNAQWVHWVFTYDDATDVAELYINGVSKGTKSVTQTYQVPAGTFVVGARGGGSDPFDGKIDEIAFYSKILSPAEVTNLYTQSGLAGVGPPPPPPSFPTIFVSPTGSDSSGTGSQVAPYASLPKAEQAGTAAFPGGFDVIGRNGSYAAGLSGVTGRTGFMTIKPFQVGEVMKINGANVLQAFTRFQGHSYPANGLEIAGGINGHLATDLEFINVLGRRKNWLFPGVNRVLLEGVDTRDAYSPSLVIDRGMRIQFGNGPAQIDKGADNITIRGGRRDGNPAVDLSPDNQANALDTDCNFQPPIGGGECLQFFSSCNNVTLEDMELFRTINYSDPTIASNDPTHPPVGTRWHTDALHFELFSGGNAMGNIFVRRCYIHETSYTLLNVIDTAARNEGKRITNVWYENCLFVNDHASISISCFGVPSMPRWNDANGLHLIGNTIYGWANPPAVLRSQNVHCIGNLVNSGFDFVSSTPASTVVTNNNNQIATSADLSGTLFNDPGRIGHLWPLSSALSSFELKAGSPARNKAALASVICADGRPFSQQTDFLGRVRGANPHIGALQTP